MNGAGSAEDKEHQALPCWKKRLSESVWVKHKIGFSFG